MRKFKAIAALTCFLSIFSTKAHALLPSADWGAIASAVVENVENVTQVITVFDATKTIGSINTTIGNPKSSYSKFMGDDIEQAKQRKEDLEGYAASLKEKQDEFDEYKDKYEKAQEQIAAAQKQYDSALSAYQQSRERLNEAKDTINNIDSLGSAVKSAGSLASTASSLKDTVSSQVMLPGQVVNTVTDSKAIFTNPSNPSDDSSETVILNEYDQKNSNTNNNLGFSDENIFDNVGTQSATTTNSSSTSSGASGSNSKNGTSSAASAPSSASTSSAASASGKASTSSATSASNSLSMSSATSAPSSSSTSSATSAPSNASTSSATSSNKASGTSSATSAPSSSSTSSATSAPSSSSTSSNSANNKSASTSGAASGNASSTTGASGGGSVSGNSNTSTSSNQGFRKSPQQQKQNKPDTMSYNIKFSETLAFGSFMGLPAIPVPDVGGELHGIYVFSDELGMYCDISVADLSNVENMKKCQLKLLGCMYSQNNSEAQECKTLYSKITHDMTMSSTAQSLSTKQVAAAYPKQVGDPMVSDITNSSTIHDDISVLSSFHKESITLLNNLLLMTADNNVINNFSRLPAFDRRAVEELTEDVNKKAKGNTK